ncbi:lanthionine synthetase C family protein [Actinomadura sp. 9N215]|uniref:lanthionine synthetase C family protein n=1 Tax=Actinomadura sp. 9N215 TaxID=3375150 RepID=UPI0037B0F8AF
MSRPAERTASGNLSATASVIVEEVARRLADPSKVVPEPGDVSVPWAPLSLSDGAPGLAMLFAELGRADPAYRPVAHRYLSLAARSVGRADGGLYDRALFDGPAALAIAARTAAHRRGDYERLLGDLDRRIADAAARRAAEGMLQVSARRPGTTFEAYDVISGLAGTGRHLLDRGEPVRPALERVLGFLVALSHPLPGDGVEIPGWWVRHGPRRLASPGGAPRPTEGSRGAHLNLGMAHGISGPLALLALAWERGVRVPGQRAAVERIAAWLLGARRYDPYGPYWPAVLPTPAVAADRPAKALQAYSRRQDGWCYGAPGVARALQLAARALDQRDWQTCALEAVHALLARPVSAGGATDAGLCHGRAGQAYLVWRIGRDAGDRVLLAGAVRLAGLAIEGFDPAARFGFRAGAVGGPLDRSGFLEGAAGTALALHAVLADTPPSGGWDAALLIA